MPMSAAKKFMFDVDFAGSADGKPAEPVITLAEHAVKLAEAEAAGRRAGYAQAQTDAEIEFGRRVADALERIAAGLGVANQALAAVESRLECEAVEVAVAVARKLAPALIAREPFLEVATLASDCFRQIVTAPHIAVRVNDALYAVAKEKLDDIARARSFEGRLVVMAEPDIAVGDCRIEWADGGINRDSAATDVVISAAVNSYISARRNFADMQEMRPAAVDAAEMPHDRPGAQELLVPGENEFRRPK
jgi:flagellar assembly protein FliH